MHTSIYTTLHNYMDVNLVKGRYVRPLYTWSFYVFLTVNALFGGPHFSARPVDLSSSLLRSTFRSHRHQARPLRPVARRPPTTVTA